MIERKRFVEPSIVKYQESLDKVTLNFNVYSDTDCDKNRGRRKPKHRGHKR